MRSSFKSTLLVATALAIALTSLDQRPVAAASGSGPAVAKPNAGASELSAARKRRRGRGVNPAIPLAAFGAIIGTIGGIAAAQQRRDYYERYYDGPAPYQGYAYPGPYAPPVPAYGYRGPYEPPGPPRGYHHGAPPAPSGDRVPP